jgi:predicted ABC-type ATPase
MRSFTIFAGVNGAGKTSIYRSIYYNENKDEKRINTDEMVARIGSWKDNKVQMKCAREAVKLIKSYILEGISFNQETTLSGKSIINNIKLAKENGFYIIINYIGVENPEIAKERVRFRVSKGGHGIPDEDIDRRYYDSLKNLENVIEICDEINIYDNTEIFKEIINFRNGSLVWKEKKMPVWANEILRHLQKSNKST